jgi:nitrogen fixation/metabolism regulation signal transduction histidine kinase
MKIRNKFIFFVAILFLNFLFLSFSLLKVSKIEFIISEIVMIFSLFISWQLYKQLIRPSEFLKRGGDNIRESNFTVKFLQTGNFEMDQLINVYNQMIDELRSERTKQEMQHFFLEKLVETSPTGIIILDFDERIQTANAQVLHLLKLHKGEVIGKPINEINHPLILQIITLGLGESKSFTVNGNTTFKIQKSHFIDRGFSRQFIILEELTSEILAAERKAYGNVIRMMAHEINNTIGPVNSILHSTLQSQTNSEIISNALLIAIERNNNLNIFMQNFADLVKIPLPKKNAVDVISLLRNITDLMKLRSGEKKIKFEYDFIPSVMIISADAQQMEQVFINIIKNAIEAIDQEGIISIHWEVENNVVCIRNTGRGITEEAQQKLFTPFFSTKKNGQGVGLTLIREMLTNHGFEFSLRTLESGWTEFKINFG